MSTNMNAKRWCDFDKLGEAIAVQFQSEEDSVHGSSHWRRVERNGLILSSHTGADVLVVRLFAWFHDSRRINDHIIPSVDFMSTQAGKELAYAGGRL